MDVSFFYSCEHAFLNRKNKLTEAEVFVQYCIYQTCEWQWHETQKLWCCEKVDIQELTWIGFWTLNTGMRAGKMISMYSLLSQSSAMRRTLGRTNGIISWLENSDVKHGRTRCITTLYNMQQFFKIMMESNTKHKDIKKQNICLVEVVWFQNVEFETFVFGCSYTYCLNTFEFARLIKKVWCLGKPLRSQHFTSEKLE